MELVGELVTGAAASGAFRVAALNHEIGNHAMKNGAIVERLTGLGDLLQQVLHRNSGSFEGDLAKRLFVFRSRRLR